MTGAVSEGHRSAVDAAGHEGAGGPADEGFGALDEPFVVPGMAAGVHHPGQALFDCPVRGMAKKPVVSLGRLRVLTVRLRWRSAHVTILPALVMCHGLLHPARSYGPVT